MGKHDQTFKELFHEQLPVLLETFWDLLLALVDKDSMTLVSSELSSELSMGKSIIADLVARFEFATDADPRPEGAYLYVHLEVQTRPAPDVAARMYHYYTSLFAKVRAPIISIVIYLLHTPGAMTQGVMRSSYQVERGQPDLTFAFPYWSIGLSRLEGATYLQRPYALAGGLAALMRRPRTMSPAAYKLACLKLVLTGAEASAKVRRLLLDIVETYVPLEGADQEEYLRLVATVANQEVGTMKQMYSEKIFEEGRQEGRQEEQRRILALLVAQRFGPLPATVLERIARLPDTTSIEQLIGQVLSAPSLEALGFAEDH